MKLNKYWLVLALIFGICIIAYAVYRTITGAASSLFSALTEPFTAVIARIQNAVNGISSTINPSNIAAGNAAGAQIVSMNNNDYAPGGAVYNQILSAQGQAAADAAWQTVQNHDAIQSSQTVSFDPLTWF